MIIRHLDPYRAQTLNPKPQTLNRRHENDSHGSHGNPEIFQALRPSVKTFVELSIFVAAPLGVESKPRGALQSV